MSSDLHLNDSAIERYDEHQAGSSLSIKSIDDIKRISLIFVKSGMFKGDKHLNEETKMYQAGVKIIAGVEFGIQPFAAMRGINIINGNAEMSANLMAAKVKSHPKYDYRVKQWDNDGCTLVFYEIPRPGAPRAEWDELGESSFDAEDARTAGLDRGDNWRKFARNMFFARAMSNGVRIHCPDVFYGAPVYTDGEISSEERIVATNTEDAEPEPVEADETPRDEASEPVAEKDDVPTSEHEQAESAAPADDEAEDSVRYLSPLQRKKIMALLADLKVKDRDERLELLSNICEREVESTNTLTHAEANQVIEELIALKEQQS